MSFTTTYGCHQPMVVAKVSKPLLNYTRSVLTTLEEYLESMELKAQRKEEVRIEAKKMKVEVERKKVVRAINKQCKDTEKLQSTIDACTTNAFKAQWRLMQSEMLGTTSNGL